GGLQMADGVQLNSAVMFVRDLDASASFYRELLTLAEVDRSPTAVLLHGDGGTQLILRSMGGNVSHALGGIGVQYVIWTAANADDLARCESVLHKRSAHYESRKCEGAEAVEGRDPDGIPVIVIYPGPDETPLHELPSRIYGW